MSTSSVAASSSPAVPSSSNSPAPVTATTTNATADLPAKTPPNPNSTTNASSNNTTSTSTTSTPASASIYGHAKRLSTSSSSSSSPFPPRPSPPNLDTPQKLARNVSPGLLARMKFLNQVNDNANKSQTDVGRIEEDKIRRLDQFHKDRNFSVERKGTAWSGIGPGRHSQTSTPLIPQHTGESVPALSMEPDFSFSDRSSVVSTSDKVLPSESEPENDDVLDMQKYRLPDTTKPNKILTQPIAQVLEPDLGINRPTMTLVPDAASPETEGGINRPTITRPITEQPARAPTPPPKDTPKPTPPAAEPEEEVSVLDDHNVIDIESYFKKRHFARAGSIYTLSKASFTNQIQGLTSMKLPPTTIASEITALPSSTLAGRALHRAANDIRLWMAKAIEVLSGLDAEDDVEWAAAAGREGLAEVDAAINKFEGLVTVYITAIEDLQARSDIAALPSRDLTTLVTQMEDIVSHWSKIKQTLKGIKNQVEIAMEWEELWNNVLGEIGAEVEDLSRLVFEMEERRHRVISDSVAEAPEKFDIAELETIVEETPRTQTSLQSKRLSMPPVLPAMSPISPIPQIEQENSRLLALFAKLQPLRASLDFLPMRLASFEARASKIFPSACDELARRKDQLEEQEKRLEAEAEALRLELGEDKWVHTFRQAGSKAVAMYNSCMKSIQRLQQAIDENDEEKIASRIASYTDKKENYLPSIKRVLQLIDIEMKRRSTVNGEILRIQQDVRTKLEDLESVTKDMDAILDDLTTSRKLRDSVSTVLSARTEASMSTSALDTPASSPASSVIMSRKGSDHKIITPARKSRQASLASSKTPKPTVSKPALPKSNPPPNRRYSSLPMGTGPSFTIRKPLAGRDDSPLRTMSATGSHLLREPATERPAVKPRWNSSVNMRDTIVGHNFKPLSLTTPSQYSKPTTPQRNLRTVSSQSNIPVRSPLSRSSALSPSPSGRPASTTPAQQVTRKPLGSPMQSPSTPARGKLPMRPTPTSSRSIGTPSSTRRILATDEDTEAGAPDDSPIARRTRPASAMTSRRSSVLSTPKQRTNSSTSQGSAVAIPGRSSSRLDDLVAGRTSRAAEGRSSRAGGRQSSMGDRPAWR